MILAHEQDITERYFFFSKGSNGADKNEFVSQVTCQVTASVISMSNIKNENIINNQ